METSQGDTYLVFPKEMGDPPLEESEKMREKLLNQVRMCAKIGIQCMDTDPTKRPNIQRILVSLGET